ncbi:hypothetical protein U9M48_013197 [Paspalum notatum var. saurae]|uniref:Uncharacterized protein n=1 Tax=Paspalum notatum var. saurae TaxID=547442 RepID=A0AAQ3SZY4_PASNO
MSLSRGRLHFKRGDDEDISPMHVTDTTPMVIPGPLTRARTRQLNQQRNKKALGTSKGEERSKEGVQVKLETQFVSKSASRDSLHQIHCPGHKRTPFSAIHICLER